MRKTVHRRRRRPFRVLFVCTGNTCRSPMAVGVLKRLLGPDAEGKVEVDSAGTQARSGAPASQEAVEASEKHGIGIAEHRSKRVTGGLVQRADLIIVMQKTHMDVVRQMCPSRAEHVMFLLELGQLGDPEGSEHEVEIPDPLGGSAETYAKCFAQIEGGLKRGLSFLTELIHGGGISR